MKNMLHYLLIPVYILTAIFILFMNGVFSGTVVFNVNLLINIGFLVVIGILLIISFASFAKLNRCTKELVMQTRNLQKECAEAEENGAGLEYLNRQDVFMNHELKEAYTNYQLRMKKLYTKHLFLLQLF